MKANITTITDSMELSRSLDRYICCTFGTTVDTYFMKYDQRSSKLTGDLYQKTDLFLVGLMRMYSDGLRAEGIYAAEFLWKNHKKALIVSGSAKAKNMNNPIYWDLSSPMELHEQIKHVLELGNRFQADITILKNAFAPYCRPPSQHHHKGNNGDLLLRAPIKTGEK